jgi:hypothetical protein
VSFSSEVEQKLASLFQGEARDQARALLPPEQVDRVLVAVLELSNGELELLRRFVEVAAVDPRDVLYWSEAPRGSDEPANYDELTKRLQRPPN